MLGCLEVVEYSLKERFNMKYLHQVSHLRLQDTAVYPVPIILLSIRYNVCTCRSPIYCCLSGTTCTPLIVQYITTSLLLLSTTVVYCIIAVCRGYVIIELVSPKDE